MARENRNVFADTQSCPEVKVNSKVPDFRCDKGRGHADAHRDPETGTRWQHPLLPYGVVGRR